jgi:hypothetical protein
MSRELMGAIEQLVGILRRHFIAVGSPPRLVSWSYIVGDRSLPPKERYAVLMDERFDRIREPGFNQLSALIKDVPDPLIAEAIKFIEPLTETAIALKKARIYIERERLDPAAAHCCYLFDELLKKRWFKPSSACLRVNVTHIRWGYSFRVFNERFLSDLIEAAHKTVARDISSALSLDREEQDIVDLLASVGHRMSTNEILGEFNRQGQIKAESTTKGKLAQLTKRKILNNRTDTNPKGYGLPAWD